MTKTQLHPYMKPLVDGFESKKFLDYSKIILKFIRETTIKNWHPLEDDYWIFLNHKRVPLSKNRWMPKLYICVTAKDYWNVVGQLILLGRREKLNWKFCKNPKLFSRPDKIIIYCKNENEIKKVTKLIKPIVSGKKSHGLLFASKIKDKNFKGFFVGIDPIFLEKTSWRYYRWVIEETIIKPNLKKGKVNSQTAAALKAMNVTLKHHGPATLTPKAKNNAFIKKIWKEIND